VQATRAPQDARKTRVLPGSLIELSINMVAGAKPADIPVEQSNE
jgi:hypothetical protein